MKWLIVALAIAVVSWMARRQDVKDAEKRGEGPPRG